MQCRNVTNAGIEQNTTNAGTQQMQCRNVTNAGIEQNTTKIGKQKRYWRLKMIKLKSLRVANKDELIKETGRKWDWDCYEVDDFAEAVDNLIWVVENCIIKNEDCYVTKDGLSFNMIKKFKRPKGHIDDIEYSFLETRNKFDTAIFYWEWFGKSVMLQYTDLGEFDNVRKSPCFIRVLTADELEDVKNLYIERFEAETGLVVNG